MTIFVYGLSFKARRENLIELFTPFGTVTSARIIVNKETRRSRGYGFVEMDDADAERAIEALNGTEHMGSTINVTKANGRPAAE